MDNLVDGGDSEQGSQVVSEPAEYQFPVSDDDACRDAEQRTDAGGVDRFDLRKVDDDVQIAVQNAFPNGPFELYGVGCLDPTLG